MQGIKHNRECCYRKRINCINVECCDDSLLMPAHPDVMLPRNHKALCATETYFGKLKGAELLLQSLATSKNATSIF